MAKSENIRNICVMGHGGDGKTSLVESMLYLTKGTDRLGKVTDGTTVCDFDPEEIKRQISISATPVPVEFGAYKLNVIDTPGYFDFEGEVLQGLRVADCGLVVMSAKGGVDVGTEKAVRRLNDRDMPKFFYVGKLDEENADFFRTYAQIREMFGVSAAPVVIPAIVGEKVVGVIDIVRRKAYKMDGTKTVEMPIPAECEDQVEEMYNTLAENVAETDEELMDKYFGGEEFTDEEFVNGIRAGVKSGSIAPIFCGSAVSGLGTENLIRGISDYAPSPLDGSDEVDPAGKAALLVFKTVSDQYGKFSFFKVMSGNVSADMTLENARAEKNEKLGHLYVVKGKKNSEVDSIVCGDIGAVSKLGFTKTGDTLREAGSDAEFEGIDFPKPCYSMAVLPVVKGGEEKIASGLTRLAEEDPVFTVVQDAETKQMVLSGMGDIHIDVLRSKLKTKFSADTTIEAPRVAYREKIRKKVKIQGKHKKQSGGHGQYGDVWVEFEPQSEQDDLIFEVNIFGGSVPKNFHPAVEKGLRDCIKRGVLAGYPVVGLKATLVDGSYHDVDSSEMAFKTAASLAYKNGLPQANPVLMEPIGSLKVYIPDANMGDVLSDLNKRRGRVMGMNPAGHGEQIVEAEVPMAEMATYAIDLRSMSQGRGSFELNFERYEEVPGNIQQKVIEESKLLNGDDE